MVEHKSSRFSVVSNQTHRLRRNRERICAIPINRNGTVVMSDSVLRPFTPSLRELEVSAQVEILYWSLGLSDPLDTVIRIGPAGADF